MGTVAAPLKSRFQLGRDLVRLGTRHLREESHAGPEDFVAHIQAGDRFQAPTDSTRPVKSCPRTWFFGARSPETAWIAYGRPRRDMPVPDEGRCSEHAHQHLVGASDRLFDVLEVQNVQGGRTGLARSPSSLSLSMPFSISYVAIRETLCICILLRAEVEPIIGASIHRPNKLAITGRTEAYPLGSWRDH